MELLKGEPVLEFLESLLISVEHFLGLMRQAVANGEQPLGGLLAHKTRLAHCLALAAKVLVISQWTIIRTVDLQKVCPHPARCNLAGENKDKPHLQQSANAKNGLTDQCT